MAVKPLETPQAKTTIGISVGMSWVLIVLMWFSQEIPSPWSWVIFSVLLSAFVLNWLWRREFAKQNEAPEIPPPPTHPPPA